MANADVLIGETNVKEGVFFDAGAETAAVATVRAFNNDYPGTGAYYNVRIAAGAQIGRIHVVDKAQSAGGVLVSSPQAVIGHADISANLPHNGSGLSIVTNDIHVNAHVKGYLGATGIGVNIPSGIVRSKVSTWTDNCKNHVVLPSVGNNNCLLFQGFSAVGETQYVGTTNFFGTNDVKIMFSDGSIVYAKQWKPSEGIYYLPPSMTPTNSREMTFELTSNTQLTIRVRGADGVPRSAAITLS